MNFIDPKGTVQQMGLKPGMKVGDFGTGSGHYAIAAAQLVGGDGRVYAIDVQEDILTRVRNLASEQGVNNVETVWGDFEKLFGTKLRDHVLDAAILSNTLFQLDDKKTTMEEIRRTLKTGGLLLVVDWSGPYGGMGPSPDRVVTEYAAEDLFIGAGFHKEKNFVPGPHHYAIIFTAP